MSDAPSTRATTAAPSSDEVLVRSAVGGDRDAFEQIVRRHESLVYAIALARLSSPSEAEEMLQAVFVAAYESLHRLRHPFNLPSWLGKITTNLCLNYLRSHKREVSLSEVPEDGLPLREDTGARAQAAMISAETLDQVLSCLAALPEPNRLAISLRYLSELSHEEISQALEVPRSTVRSRIHEGLKMLRKRLRVGG